MNNVIKLFCLSAFFIFLYCATQKPVIKEPKAPLPSAAGIDSSDVAKIDSVASIFIISEQDKQHATGIFEQTKSMTALSDSLWDYYSLLKDNTVPQINIISPKPFERNIRNDAKLIFFITDIRSPIDFSKMDFRINNNQVNHKKVSIIHRNSGESIIYKPALPFNFLQRVNIDLRLFDTAGNVSDSTYFFWIEDSLYRSTPTIKALKPEPYSKDVLINTDIVLQINDTFSILDTCSISLKINNESIEKNSYKYIAEQQSGKLIYQPEKSFDYNENVYLEFTITDTTKKLYNYKYWFMTEDSTDKIPPRIQLVKPEISHNKISPESEFVFYVTDIHSGIDLSKTVLNVNNVMIVSNQIVFGNDDTINYKPKHPFQLDSYVEVTLSVTDTSGNSTDSTFVFQTFNKSDLDILPTLRDSLTIRTLIKNSLKILGSQADEIQKMQKKSGYLSLAVIQKTSILLLEKVQSELDKAIEVDPFNLNIRAAKIQQLEKLAEISGDNNYYRKAADEQEKIIEMQKGNHNLYGWLARLYAESAQWEIAFQNYKQAQYVLEQTALFEIQDAKILSDELKTIPVDKVKLVEYLYNQADAKAHLYDDVTAISILNSALNYATSENEINAIKDYINWINWDDGQIRNVEIKDSLVAQYKEKQYIIARQGFLSLLKQLKTTKAKDEIQWRIASIDFEHLNKKEDAVVRLLPVIQSSPQDSLGSPIDSSYQIYFRDYANMCYSIGVNYRDNNEYKKAFIYFTQSAAINWQFRGSSYLELAALSSLNISNLNSKETLKNCLLALDLPITNDERQFAYRLLYEVNLHLGNFKVAKNWFHKYNNVE